MRAILVTLSAITFVLSLMLPALYFKGVSWSGFTDYWYTGFTVLMVGWLAICGLQFGWFANVLAPLSFVFIRFGKRKAAQVCAVLSLMLLIDAFFFDSPIRIKQFGPGAYLWCISIALGSLSCFFKPCASGQTALCEASKADLKSVMFYSARERH